MRKTIYVSSQEVWDDVCEKAKDRGLSVSRYLLGVDGFIEHRLDVSQLDRIESKLDALSGGLGPLPVKPESGSRGIITEASAGQKLATKKLDKKLTKRVVERARDDASASPDPYFKPKPKGGSK